MSTTFMERSDENCNNKNNNNCQREGIMQKHPTNFVEHDHCYARPTTQLWKLKRQKYLLTFKLCKICSQELYSRKNDDITECSDGGVDLVLHLCRSCTVLNMKLSDMNSAPFMANHSRNLYNSNNNNNNNNDNNGNEYRVNNWTDRSNNNSNNPDIDNNNNNNNSDNFSFYNNNHNNNNNSNNTGKTYCTIQTDRFAEDNRWWAYVDEIDEPPEHRAVRIGVSFQWNELSVGFGAYIVRSQGPQPLSATVTFLNNNTNNTPMDVQFVNSNYNNNNNANNAFGDQQRQQTQHYHDETHEQRSVWYAEEYEGEQRNVAAMLQQTSWSPGPFSPPPYHQWQEERAQKLVNIVEEGTPLVDEIDQENRAPLHIVDTPKTTGRFPPPPSKWYVRPNASSMKHKKARSIALKRHCVQQKRKCVICDTEDEPGKAKERKCRGKPFQCWFCQAN
ncbi:hypothetical protein niasHT_009596 [Heterodera trifolii]|uniref:Uncharacterized protein n=1 Tax=Heterodera trifolii TaxID=157864 RepID=A0ABD2M5D5_9BILA